MKTKKMLLALSLALSAALLLSACGGSGGNLGSFVQDVADAVDEEDDQIPWWYVIGEVVVDPNVPSGWCGDDITWRCEDGVLTLEGSGPMTDYPIPHSEIVNAEDYPAPWQRIADEITTVLVSEGITAVGKQAFQDLPCLTDVSLPSTLTEIGFNAFSDCVGLQEITIPEGVTEISYEAFDGCEQLREVTLPDSVTAIGSSAFYGCKQLQEITLPDTLTGIDGLAFYGCNQLRLTVPAGVTFMGYQSFSGERLMFLGDAPAPSNGEYDSIINPDDYHDRKLTIVYRGEGFEPYIEAYRNCPNIRWVKD